MQIELITGLPADAVITVYRVGPMVDLCSGPHLPNSGYLKVSGSSSGQQQQGGHLAGMCLWVSGHQWRP